jgi:hypothetical protein
MTDTIWGDKKMLFGGSETIIIAVEGARGPPVL